jgi:predicted 2-oxoglutarate/Fe(II)-dependent dioxygenase YbiX/peroxiredoxin
MMAAKYVNLTAGDAAPWFEQRSFSNPRFTFDTVAGKYLVLCFFTSLADPQSRAAIDAMLERPDLFDGVTAAFFGVSLDPRDEVEKRCIDQAPGYFYFWDFDGLVSRLYGAVPIDARPGQGPVPARRQWVVLDPTMRVLRVFAFAPDRGDARDVLSYLGSLPPPARFAGFELQAPILYLPNVFEPAFCRKLIALYETHGGEETGFMRQVDGKTVAVHDYRHKRRRDYIIADPTIIQEALAQLQRRLLPQILKAHQFRVTRMERCIVSCYAEADGGHFRAHRDNTTKGTAHRRFAVSINLNDNFDGGEISFPEYGPRSFKMPAGGAVVFSCSLLHAVSPVTRGNRYAFLPFLYDEEAERLREANLTFVDAGVATQKSAVT